MAHIHTDAGHHDTTVSAYIIKHGWGYDMAIDSPKLLLHMHKKYEVLLQPGGHVELHENPWSALEHEILEETGYDMSQLYLIQFQVPSVMSVRDDSSILHPIPFYIQTHDAGDNGHRHTDSAYVFVTTEEPNHGLAEDESQDLRWLSPEEVAGIPDEMVGGIVKDAAPVIFNTLEDSELPWIMVKATHPFLDLTK